MKERLDRLLYNFCRKALGFFNVVTHVVAWGSDHRHILVSFKNSVGYANKVSLCKRHFQYEAFWKEYGQYYFSLLPRSWFRKGGSG